ncbi:Rho GTPase activation protein [Lactarius psammicola]|nr:Rho GTPase activation protein [Lactarius psammicola]
MATEHRDQRDTKAGLRTWWQQFTTAQKVRPSPQHSHSYPHSHPRSQTQPHEYVPPPAGAVFGRPLKESLKYANVQISTADANGKLYVWGYIPVVVAKCGLFLKENATEIEGTFRVNGSNKRMRELQAIFETPPRYGKSLDWKAENYTTHDVASVFRRYLTLMPEPVIPYNLYFPFREAIAKKPYNQEAVIATYKRLIHSMAHANQYLLLYVLDLLSVFARKSDKNLMTAQNLAVIFRPGLMSHPEHELSPSEHQLSQDVLEFLIAHQDWFMLDTPPPPAFPPTPSRSLTPPYDAGARTSVSDGEGPDGWRIIQRHQRSVDERGRHGATASSTTTTANKVAPQPQSSAAAPPGIVRSRTLPTSRKGRPGAADGSAGPGASTAGAKHGGAGGVSPAVLRKTRRASVQPC